MTAAGPAETPRRGDAQALLSVRDIFVRFGGIIALNGVSFDVEKGQIVGLIGPNGAGKTTLFNCLSRLYIPHSGEILFEGRSIMQLPRHAIAARGMGRTFQNVALFDRISVLDNIKIGCHSDTSAGFISSFLRLPGVEAEEKRITERAHEMLAFMELEPYALMPAGPLPFPSASAWNWQGRWPPARNFSCSMSLRLASTMRKSRF